jgi:molecular chaperone DnaJ
MSIDFDPTIDYYKALGVDPKASADDIKKAYRKLAKQFHPDSTGGDKTKEQRFKDIGNAYDVLGDPKRRAQYDEVRAMGGRRRPASPAAGPGGASGNPGQVWDLGDLFSQMFAGGPQAAPAAAVAGAASASSAATTTAAGCSSTARAGRGRPTRRPRPWSPSCRPPTARG